MSEPGSPEIFDDLYLGLRAGGALRKQRRGEELTEEEVEALGHWQRLSAWRKVVAVGAFAIGTFGFLARRNAISMLMSIELMLNGVNLAIVAFGSFGVAKAVVGAATPDRVALAAEGSVIALMVIAVAAAEATVGLAIVIAIYRNKKTPLVDEYDAMRQ